MKITETPLKGAYIIEPKVFSDHRGKFLESYNEKMLFEKLGLNINFVQDNCSVSQKNVLRGLHYQKGMYWQAKLVYVTYGSVQDVIVDCRKDSPTFGQHFSIILDDKKCQQLFIPKGFLHGFLTLEDHTIFNYKCDEFYHPDSDSGIMYNDPDLAIKWSIDDEHVILSEKDNMNKQFKEAFYD